MWITRISIHNPVFATMMTLALVVLGLFSYQRLSVEQFPNVDFPLVVVQTAYPGASPETVESDVSRPIEDAVNTISGVKTLTSRSYQGTSLVIIEFDLSTNSATALQEVREKIAGIRNQFREEVEEPVVSRFNPDEQPIISIAVQSNQRSLRDLTTMTDQTIVKYFQNVRGVGRATIVGGVKRQILVYLKPDRLQALGIGVDQAMNAVANENQDLPAGSVTKRNIDQTVQIQEQAKTPQDLLNIIVARRAGAPIYLSQIADVIDGQEEESTVALINGAPALAIDIVKIQGTNTIEVVDNIYRTLDELKHIVPSDVQLNIVRDASQAIRNSITNVRHTLIEGALLTILIVFIFLVSWRSTVITGLTLPVSVIGTFFFVFLFGFTLNMLTLMGLSLVIGILIDDAIVVRENITRHLAMGKDHRTAALEGTREIGLAVLATTLSIVAVFLPVAFMGGIVGRFFYQFGITIATAVLISLFVSYTLDPMLSSIWYDPAAHGIKPKGLFGRLVDLHDRLLDRTKYHYRNLLMWSLRRRLVVSLLAFFLFIGSFFLVPLIGVEFVPRADLGELYVQFKAPTGSSLEYTQAKLKQAEAALKEFPEVVYTYGTINTGYTLGKNNGSIYVKLTPVEQRKRNAEQLTQAFRARLKQIAGLTISVAIPGAVGTESPIQVSIQGRDLRTLAGIAEQTQAIMRSIPGVVDIDSSLEAARPELGVRIKREAASDLGIGTQQIASTLRPLLEGTKTSTWKAPDGENYDVLVRLPKSERQTQADIENLYLASSRTQTDGTPQMVKLTQVAEIVPDLGASQINRRSLSREVLVTADTYGIPVGDASRQINAQLKKINLPNGYRFVTEGAQRDIAETSGYAASALILAVVFIYLILASLFGSFLLPLAIMVSLPLSLIGVFLGLLITGSTLNMFSIIGFITLMGLVTKNAILLVDFINKGIRDGLTHEEAVIQAGTIRLRPIVMTTLAMIFGMLPLALGVGEGSEQRAPMAHAVIGGLITSTLLTLVVVPTLYTYIDSFSERARAFFKRKNKHSDYGSLPASD